MVASGSLLLLCLLVLVSNYIDRNHTDNVKGAISTLYEDRLVAEEYIFRMTNGIYQVREMILSDSTSYNATISINNLLLQIRAENSAYQKTKFTMAERIKADELLLILKNFDAGTFKSFDNLLQNSNQAISILNELSAIQLEESKKIMSHAETLYVTGKASSRFVFAVIIVILLVLQALVFTSKPLVQNGKQDAQRLN